MYRVDMVGKPFLVAIGILCLQGQVAYADCCRPVTGSCDLGPVHPEAHCRVGTPTEIWTTSSVVGARVSYS